MIMTRIHNKNVTRYPNIFSVFNSKHYENPMMSDLDRYFTESFARNPQIKFIFVISGSKSVHVCLLYIFILMFYLDFQPLNVFVASFEKKNGVECQKSFHNLLYSQEI